MASNTYCTTRPLYRILVVCETSAEIHKEEKKWFTQWSKELKDKDLSVELITYHIGLNLEDLQKFNLVNILKGKSSALIDHVKTASNGNGPCAPIIFVGFGFAALVVMEAVRAESQLDTMGVVVATVAKSSATWKSPIFQKWYDKLVEEDKLAKERRLTMEEELAYEEDLTIKEKDKREKDLEKKEDPDFTALKKVLTKFNDYCRHERIRFSYVFRQKEVSNCDKKLGSSFANVLMRNSVTSSLGTSDTDGLTSKRTNFPWRKFSTITSLGHGLKSCFCM